MTTRTCVGCGGELRRSPLGPMTCDTAWCSGNLTNRPPADYDFTVQKIGYTMPISAEVAMDHGLIPDTRPPAPKPSLRRRLRWWWWDHKPHLHFGPCPQEDE